MKRRELLASLPALLLASPAATFTKGVPAHVWRVSFDGRILTIERDGLRMPRSCLTRWADIKLDRAALIM